MCYVMPTDNPRINVTLSHSLDALVGKLASHQRVSKAAVLRDLLETAEPTLRHVVALMDAAEGASVDARRRLAEDLHSGVQAADGVTALMLSNLAHGMRDLVADAEAVRGRRPARAARSVHRAGGDGRRSGAAKPRKDPPSSNRGVK